MYIDFMTYEYQYYYELLAGIPKQKNDENQYIYVIHQPRLVHIGKNCPQGLRYCPRPTASGSTQDRGHSFSS